MNSIIPKGTSLEGTVGPTWPHGSQWIGAVPNASGSGDVVGEGGEGPSVLVKMLCFPIVSPGVCR